MANMLRRERLRDRDTLSYEVKLRTTMSGLKGGPQSVGTRLMELISKTVISSGSEIQADEPHVPVARDMKTWRAFAKGWKKRVETSRLATIVLGLDDNDEVKSILVGDVEGHIIAVPVLFVGGKDVQVADFIETAMPDLLEVLSDARIVKVICPADVTQRLVHDDVKVSPVLDPVLAAELQQPAKFKVMITDLDNETTKTTTFGIKLAVHFYLGQQHGPYLDDERADERERRNIAQWPSSATGPRYTPAQKRWMIEQNATCLMAMLTTADQHLRPSQKEKNESYLGSAFVAALRHVGLARQGDLQFWGRSERKPQVKVDKLRPLTLQDATRLENGRFNCSEMVKRLCGMKPEQKKAIRIIDKNLQKKGIRFVSKDFLEEYKSILCIQCGEAAHHKSECRLPLALSKYKKGKTEPLLTLPCIRCHLVHPADVCEAIHYKCQECGRQGE